MQQAQRRQQFQHIGKSSDWYSTKFHATINKVGCPTRFIITCGNIADCSQPIPLLCHQKVSTVVAVRGYDSQEIVDAFLAMSAEPVIPPRSMRKGQHQYDRKVYKAGNAIERMFCRMKQCRRIATRYDKLADTFPGFLYAVGIWIWTS